MPELHWILQRIFLFQGGGSAVLNIQAYDDREKAMADKNKFVEELGDIYKDGGEEVLGHLGLKGIAYGVAAVPFVRSSGIVLVDPSAPAPHGS